MTEVLFYHLHDMTLERVLPSLLEKTLERGWRAVVQASSEERVEALDNHLWTYREDSFLPHGPAHGREAVRQPVVLTADASNPNAAQVRFLVDGAGLPDDADAYTRVVLVFDGDDDAALTAARASWTAAKAKGFDVTYWQPDAEGRWQRKA
ncbi:MAG: DNA polymerase III subunit chi [Xanthobacteraceae bacterium]|nr:MAG: DNA polymerase III subunit chi [Xanthobacteraceae bacterium]